MRKFDKLASSRLTKQAREQNWHPAERNGRLYKCRCSPCFRLSQPGKLWSRFGGANRHHSGSVNHNKRTPFQIRLLGDRNCHSKE